MLPPPGGGGGGGGGGMHQQQQYNQTDSNNKVERPNTLGGSNKLSRRGVNICYHNEHCKWTTNWIRLCSTNFMLEYYQ